MKKYDSTKAQVYIWICNKNLNIFLSCTLKNPSCKSVGSNGFPSGIASLEAFSIGMMYSNQNTCFIKSTLLL